MTEQLKQRVWGMVILVAVGVVFLPDLLDGKKETTKSEFKKIPTPPVFNDSPETIEFPQQKLEDAIAKVPSTAEVTENNGMSSGPNEDKVPANSEIDVDGSELESDQVEVATLTKVNPESEFSEVTDSNSVSNSSAKDKTNEAKTAAANEQTVPIIASRPLWILQLGSFKHKENVVALREKLDKAGIKTFTKPITTKAGILSKVYVGPEEDKSKLTEVQKTLKEVTGLAGKITRYSPIN